MQNYIFFASKIDEFSFNISLVEFSDLFAEFDVVTLDSEVEFEILLKSIGLTVPTKQSLESDDFDIFYDISNQNLIEFSDESFGEFYSKWLIITNRENTMNEYGQLIFLKNISQIWEKKKFRFTVREKFPDVA